MGESELQNNMENAETDGEHFSQSFPLCVLVCPWADSTVGVSSSQASWTVRMALRYKYKGQSALCLYKDHELNSIACLCRWIKSNS